MAAPKDVTFRIRAIDRTRRVFRSVGRGIGRLADHIFSLKAALLGVLGVAGIGAVVRDTVRLGKEVEDLAGAFDSSESEVDAWRIAMEQTGGDISDVVGIVSGLNSAMGDVLDRNPDFIRAFDTLGVSFTDVAKKSPVDVLKQIFDTINNTPDLKTLAEPLAKIFGDDDSFRIQRAARDIGGTFDDFYAKLIADGQIASDESRDQLDKIGKAFSDLRNRFRALTSNIIGQLGPLIVRFFEILLKKIELLPGAVDRTLKKIPEAIASLKSMLIVIGGIQAAFRATLEYVESLIIRTKELSESLSQTATDLTPRQDLQQKPDTGNFFGDVAREVVRQASVAAQAARAIATRGESASPELNALLGVMQESVEVSRDIRENTKRNVGRTVR